eukprot:COSAG02_NODE_3278_length_7026_cov_28.128771_4_plen_158_part_00
MTHDRLIRVPPSSRSSGSARVPWAGAAGGSCERGCVVQQLRLRIPVVATTRCLQGGGDGSQQVHGDDGQGLERWWRRCVRACASACVLPWRQSAGAVPGRSHVRLIAGSPVTKALKVIAAYGLIQGMTSDLVCGRVSCSDCCSARECATTPAAHTST